MVGGVVLQMAPLPVVRVRVFRQGCSVTVGVVAEYHPDRVGAAVCRWLWLVQSEQSSFGHGCRYCRTALVIAQGVLSGLFEFLQ